jgi:hypothetical protein
MFACCPEGNKGKQGRAAGGGGKSRAALKAAKEAQARLQAASEEAAKRLESASSMGHALLHLVYKHAISYSMNCAQVGACITCMHYPSMHQKARQLCHFVAIPNTLKPVYISCYFICFQGIF